MDSRATQQCNLPPYLYAVHWLLPATWLENALDWLRECVTRVTRHARIHKLQMSGPTDYCSLELYLLITYAFSKVEGYSSPAPPLSRCLYSYHWSKSTHIWSTSHLAASDRWQIMQWANCCLSSWNTANCRNCS